MRTQKCHISGQHIASILEVLLVDISILKLKKNITYTFTASNPQLQRALLTYNSVKYLFSEINIQQDYKIYLSK
jgi:hypothetical protein